MSDTTTPNNNAQWRRIGVAGAAAALVACGGLPVGDRSDAAVNAVETLVVIYAENRAFDTLYGLFPGANGIPGLNPSAVGAYVPQKDFDGSLLPALPPTWGGLTANGQPVTLTQAQSSGLANKPFRIDDPAGLNGSGVVVSQAINTRDLVHRFYNNIMQIGDGSNDRFAAYSDAGGLAMGYYDGSSMKLWQLARQYTLADNFFMGAFGGSYLNHQYLICACVPVVRNVDVTPSKSQLSEIEVDAKGNFVRLTPAADMPASALNGAPRYKLDGALTPKEPDGSAYTVNTMQPPYQPSGIAPAADGDIRYGDVASPFTVPPQTMATIGDRLDAKGVPWAWYAGAWAKASGGTPAARNVIYRGKENFQPHHQPFNYFANFDPQRHQDRRGAHLLDFDARFFADADAGKLPPVTFYKPQGNLNQHPGYANMTDGDAHIAEVIERLQKTPQWPKMLIVVTYDENGGSWDHVRVPKGDRWGPATRIPALIVSPLAQRGFIDKTQYDTGSILRFITRRWKLEPLPGVQQRDAALKANGFAPMGDLSAALRAAD
ncbi:MAG TPA: acid phosphatase [Burkholderiaceae bacterium]|nr:acid phosphatase [Burkholderiaceae bacterium]